MRAFWFAILVSAGVAGCMPRPTPSVSDPDPMVKIPAMVKAVREHDAAAVKQLVADLDSDDGAVRFYAINALERLTQDRFGYEYYQDSDVRRPAVGRWQQWMEGHQTACCPHD